MTQLWEIYKEEPYRGNSKEISASDIEIYSKEHYHYKLWGDTMKTITDPGKTHKDEHNNYLTQRKKDT